MGLFTDLASIDQIGPKQRVGLNRASAEQLLSKAHLHDPSAASAYAAADAAITLVEETDAGAADTYTLTFTFNGGTNDGTSVTTAAIAYNAVDTAIESAIDTAFTTASFPSWTNADISVAMGGAAGLDDGTVTLTFDGASVTGQSVTVSLTATGFTSVNSATTDGQGARKAVQALFDLNVVSGTLHAVGSAPTDWVKPASNGQSRPRRDLIKSLCLEAAKEEGNDNVYDTVMALYPLH